MDETKPQPETVSAITLEPKPEAKKDAVENLVIETYEPKKSCRKCYGRGIIGLIEGDPNKPYYCTCIMKVKKELTPEQSAAYLKATAKPAGPTGPQGTTVVEDATIPKTGIGPCPAGEPGAPGVAGDPQASV
jgi:hypothetical protein